VYTNAGSLFSIAVAVDGGSDIAAAPMQVQFDPKFVKLNDITLGDLFLKSGQQPVFTRNILNDTGTATIQLGLMPGSPGVSGPGMLVSLVFQTLGRGSSMINVTGLSVTNSQGQVVASGNLQVPITSK
jgi:general secretion pathway protein D